MVIPDGRRYRRSNSSFQPRSGRQSGGTVRPSPPGWYGRFRDSALRLRPGQNIEYIITNIESAVPNDRVRAFALWDGWLCYDRKKYVAMLREAFEPFEQFTLDRLSPADSNDPRLAEELVRFLLFAAMKFPRPGV